MSQVFIEMCGGGGPGERTGTGCGAADGYVPGGLDLPAGQHPFPGRLGALSRREPHPLLKAVKLLRAAGLRGRMPNEPPVFAKQMNRWCIAMTHSPTAPRCEAGPPGRAPPDETPAAHHRRARPPPPRPPRCRLARTRCSERQATRIIARIDAMLEQLPAAIKQAHERIIGARSVPNAEKILCVYEPDVQTVVRGKASGEVEFGNTLMISENVTGLITDWQLYQGMTPAEWRQFDQSLERQNQFDLSTPIKAASTDRGFSTQRLCERLAEADIYDATCPRDPQQLQRRMQEPQFVALQHRRASTEARIAIIKQRQGKRLSARGFTNRYLAVAWSILGHNLWLIARLLADQPPQAQAA
ncbi:MAG: hypothetical protein J6386_20565 [Candidatus Synoicihabitans palmerolidicus]|nr:hypothetical protein [Candidatus Synoicihabitans palmerolidicus]